MRGRAQTEGTGRPDRHRHAGLDAALLAVLSAGVLVVHPFGYIVQHPYWRDESWVAVLSKAPLRQWVSLSSSTPLGWLLAVRWEPVGRDSLRIVPLLFTAGVVVMAYVIARGLPWRNVTWARFAGVAAGLVVLLAPVSLLRNDLKQYTSDAFFSLVVVELACRFDSGPTRRRLVVLTIGSAVAIMFSTAAMFVVIAVSASMGILALASRSWHRLREITIATAGLGVVVGPYLGGVVFEHDNRALHDYWKPYYLSTHGLHAIPQAWQRLEHLRFALAMPALVFVGLIVAGVIVFARSGRPSMALAIPILWIEMFTAGVAGRYPFLDRRTSHFLLIVSLVAGAIGITGIVVALAERSRLLAGLLVVGLAGGYAYGVQPYIRIHSIPDEDVRSQVVYAADHYEHGDVIVVSYQSDWGFTYYWPAGDRQYFADRSGKSSNGFFTRLAHQPDIVYVESSSDADTTGAMRDALSRARASGGTGRIWIIRTYVNDDEHRAWTNTFSTLKISPSVLRVGVEPLLLVSRSS